MIASLTRSFDQLQRQKAGLVQSLQSMSPGRLAHRPSAASWSALEIADHLARTEHAILGAVKAQMPWTTPVPRRDQFRAFLIASLFRTPARVKVPRAAAHVLPGELPRLPEVLALWDETRVQMAATLDPITPDVLARGAFRHPVSGWMTVTNTLRFLSVHMVHHQYQLNRQGRDFARSSQEITA